MFFQLSFESPTSGAGVPLQTALSNSVTGAFTADFLNGTLAAMKDVGAAVGLDVRGAALAGVIGGTTTAAPSEDELKYCFINQDCIISAVVIGVVVLVAIILTITIITKICGSSKNDEAEKVAAADQKRQREYEMERKASQNNINNRRSSTTYDQMMAAQSSSGGGVLVAPELVRKGSMNNMANSSTAVNKFVEDEL